MAAPAIAVGAALWQRVDRPHGRLEPEAILEGMLAFSSSFAGELVTETMLVAGLNDGVGCVTETADFLARLQPSRAYVSIPIRPPAKSWVRPPTEEALNRAYQLIAARLDQVEYLIGYEGSTFAFTGDVEQNLLGITAVHPMRQDAVDAFLERAETGWATVDKLVSRQQLVRVRHDGQTYYMRKLR